MLARDAASKDFVTDAAAHCKFIAINDAAKPLLARAGISGLDDGFVLLTIEDDAASFFVRCRDLRYWARELTVDLDAASPGASPTA